LGLPGFREPTGGATDRTKYRQEPVEFSEELPHLAFIPRAKYRLRHIRYPKKDSNDLNPSQAWDTQPTYFSLSSQYYDYIAGPNSTFGREYSKNFEFVQKLGKLGVVPITYRKHEANFIEIMKSTAPHIRQGQHFQYQEILRQVDELELLYGEMNAAVRLATHMALDTIAFLAGLEAPKFPPDERIMGTGLLCGPSQHAFPWRST
jgi:hypothetical protein